ncbi:hypothetical protein, partial [Nocardia asiatica]|uniref:hypothetical protein n=1 Tax=Nocardia asiatica TaxID=209252 RepID=UPI002454F9C5
PSPAALSCGQNGVSCHPAVDFVQMLRYCGNTTMSPHASPAPPGGGGAGGGGAAPPGASAAGFVPLRA